MSTSTLVVFNFSANKESLKIPETPGVSVALAALFFAQVFEVKFAAGHTELLHGAQMFGDGVGLRHVPPRMMKTRCSHH